MALGDNYSKMGLASEFNGSEDVAFLSGDGYLRWHLLDPKVLNGGSWPHASEGEERE